MRPSLGYNPPSANPHHHPRRSVPSEYQGPPDSRVVVPSEYQGPPRQSSGRTIRISGAAPTVEWSYHQNIRGLPDGRVVVPSEYQGPPRWSSGLGIAKRPFTSAKDPKPALGNLIYNRTFLSEVTVLLCVFSNFLALMTTIRTGTYLIYLSAFVNSFMSIHYHTYANGNCEDGIS